MKRRSFITLLGGAACWPLAARAPQPAMPVIGYFSGTSTYVESASVLGALRQGLNETGFVEGQSVSVTFSSAQNHSDLLPGLAEELVRRKVAVIVAAGNGPTLAAKAATTAIPIVF